MTCVLNVRVNNISFITCHLAVLIEHSTWIKQLTCRKLCQLNLQNTPCHCLESNANFQCRLYAYLTKVIQETRGVGYVFVRIVKLIMYYMYKLMLAKSKSIWHSKFNGLLYYMYNCCYQYKQNVHIPMSFALSKNNVVYVDFDGTFVQLSTLILIFSLYVIVLTVT